MQKTCIVIVGPTAVGKTALSIELAKHYNTEIISADSRQCFRELNIGVAKPTPDQLEAVRHHFINSHSIHDNVNAAVFAEYARATLSRIFQHHDCAIVVGGTGLYIRAFSEGLDDVPSIPEDVRLQVRASYEQNGLAWLQQQVQSEDPDYFYSGEVENPQRLMRALEVKRATGRSIRSFQSQPRAALPFVTRTIGLTLPRETLYDRIHARVDEMMREGLLDEARQLLPNRHLNALQTVGYQELFDFLLGHGSLDEAVTRIRQNTRQYAKRQLTWFRKDTATQWFAPTCQNEILAALPV